MWCYQFWNFELCLRKKSQNLKRNFTRVFKWFLNNDFFYFWSSCMTITSRFRDGFCPWSFMIAHDCPRWPWMVGWIFFSYALVWKKHRSWTFIDDHWRSLTIWWTWWSRMSFKNEKTLLNWYVHFVICCFYLILV